MTSGAAVVVATVGGGLVTVAPVGSDGLRRVGAFGGRPGEAAVGHRAPVAVYQTKMLRRVKADLTKAVRNLVDEPARRAT